MINFKIDNKQFNLPEKWSEITLKEYVKIYSIINKNQFKDEEINADNFEDLKKHRAKERALHNLKVNRLIFKEMTNLDDDIINRTNQDDIIQSLSIMGNFLNSKIEKSKRECFVYKNKTYWFPVLNMEKSSFGDFIEAAQLDMLAEKYDAGKFEVVAEQMAILCREENEIYDEVKVEKKKKLFNNLTMDIVWDFVFFLTEQTNSWKTNFQTYLKKA